MANLIDIRRRIRSVKSTQQITKAMKMVAAARLRRSQDRILATRPYARELQKVIANLAARAIGRSGGRAEKLHPLLVEREVKKVLLLVVTGDKGLCGPFNSSVLRQSQVRVRETAQIDLLLLGKKGVDFYKRRDTPIKDSHSSLFTSVRYEDAEAIAREVSRAYVEGEYDAVQVVYNTFRSIMTQELTQEQLLPIPQPKVAADAASPEGANQVDYLYEPSPDKILAELLPRYVTFQVYRVLLESQAAEHAARMKAMDSATKNAREMIDHLTLVYNRARQAAITKELIEVVSGSSAMRG